MQSSAPTRLYLVVFVALAANVLLCRPAFGGSVTVTLTSAGANGSTTNLCSGNCTGLTDFTVTEDGSDHDVFLGYTVTNNSGGTITFNPFGSIFGYGPITGDQSDYFYINPSDLVFTTCLTLSKGSSCMMNWDVGTYTGAGEVDGDSGTGAFITDVDYFPPGGGAETMAFATNVYITVQDPPPPTVPEPSSLLLLGSGVAALVGALRRRLHGGAAEVR